MKAYVCDRCGKFVRNETAIKLRIKYAVNNPKIGLNPDSFDFCPTCVTALKDWITDHSCIEGYCKSCEYNCNSYDVDLCKYCHDKNAPVNYKMK